MHFLTQNLVHIAAMFTLLSFLFRDQIKLRIFAAVGDALVTIYFFVAFDQPLWNSMLWSFLNVCINSAMILLILRDGRQGGMSDLELSLFRNLDALSPGQFRNLMKIGKWHKSEDATVLTSEGEALNKLYYVLSGKILIAKANRALEVSPKLFIGELAFLRQRPATATVTVSADGDYVSWDHDDLEKLFQRNEDLRTAMKLLMGRDVAEKMAKS